MRDHPYTRGQMDAARAAPDPRESPFDGLRAEAKAALGYSSSTLRAVRDRYREASVDELATWEVLRDELDRLERRPRIAPTGEDPAAAPSETEAQDLRLRGLRARADALATELALHQRELSRLELAAQGLESAWLFLERGGPSLAGAPTELTLPANVAMRLVEAQEAERSRLAQEIHDGPAQALSNAIFQVEYIERVIERDERLARTELRFLRELLRRELGDVRSFISQLRPPVLEQLGLDGAIHDAIETGTALTGLPTATELRASPDRLSATEQTVVLRVVQEALQNVRKHAAATRASVATRLEDGHWVLEVRDDGRGFEVGAVAAHGRRNFGLQFMRERAELIGALFEVRSRQDEGTIVRLAIPIGGEESR